MIDPPAPIVVAMPFDGNADASAPEVSVGAPPPVASGPDPAAEQPAPEPVSRAEATPPIAPEAAAHDEDAEPPRPAQPPRPVASLPPDVAAAIADRLRLARERALTPSTGPADNPPSVSLPPVAPWSVSLPPPEPDPPAIPLPADPERPAATARKGRRPGIARIGKSAPDRSTDASKPAAVRPGLVEARAALERYTSGAPETGEPSSGQPPPAEPPAPPVAAVDDAGKRPVPVVKRAKRAAALSDPEAAETAEPSPARRVVEAFDPIANLPPRSSDPAAATYQFPSIAVPAQSPDVDLEPEERSRRVANLARRLKSLKSRSDRPADEDDGAPPARSGSS
jgi:hypothetical protein